MNSEPLATWDRLVAEQRELLESTVGRYETLEALNKELQQELSAYKTAFAATSKELEESKEKNHSLERALSDLNAHNSCAVVAIDGDGYPFAPFFIRQGRKGGQDAASSLRAKLSNYPGSECQIFAFVYFNRTDMVDNLLARGLIRAPGEFDAFIAGFNQASPLFHMIDVGHGKESTDAKLRGLCEYFSQLPQTKQIYFAGGHKGGYAPFLRSLCTAGESDKLVLLKSDTPFVREIQALKLSHLDCRDLFLGIPPVLTGDLAPSAAPSYQTSTTSEVYQGWCLYPASNLRSTIDSYSFQRKTTISAITSIFLPEDASTLIVFCCMMLQSQRLQTYIKGTIVDAVESALPTTQPTGGAFGASVSVPAQSNMSTIRVAAVPSPSSSISGTTLHGGGDGPTVPTVPLPRSTPNPLPHIGPVSSPPVAETPPLSKNARKKAKKSQLSAGSITVPEPDQTPVVSSTVSPEQAAPPPHALTPAQIKTFRPLIEVLQQLRQKGVHDVLYARAGELLRIRDKDYLGKNGVPKSLTAYAALAQASGIIVIRPTDKPAFPTMSLLPSWHETLVADTTTTS
ncbi:hypothetical protein DL93DRAFT_2162086 [Clavulina sp. PMI_390]|nr:hypothetical protein DL93DRAFT_2162086 [Clavulina sp. PMI_390]